MKIIIVTDESKTIEAPINEKVPAFNAYRGLFTEVFLFSKRLRELGHQVDLKIISTKYGLIDECEQISQYKSDITNESEILGINKNLKISSNLEKIVRNYDIILLFIPKYYFPLFYSPKEQIDVFKSLKRDARIIVVGSSSIEENLKGKYKIDFFQKAGVARIGKRNAEKIIKLLQGA